jgi:hypothetical protein
MPAPTPDKHTHSVEGIEHLDFDLDKIAKVAMAASEAMEELGEDIEQAVMVVRTPEDGVRVFFIGNPDSTLVTLDRALLVVKRAIWG